jgi:hypothetical protein
MKETIIALCTPDMNRPMAREAIERLKSTDLRRAEVMIFDNAYDDRFHHPSIMEEMLNYAAGRPVVFMDDDVLLRDADWMDRLFQTADESGAAIVGCAHVLASGELNHRGILVYHDGSTELLRQIPGGDGGFVYSPAVSSALMLVKNTDGLHFDLQFEKYQHDVDICISAWKSNYRVACALNLEIVHTQAEYMSRVPGFREVLDRDIRRFQQKWQHFAANGFYQAPELAAYATLAQDTNWERFYNEASLSKSADPQRSANLFRQLINQCPHSWHRAGAYFHLYLLEKEPEHLRSCLGLNPSHQKAAALLHGLVN